jgi:hypothetical protein
MGGVESLTYDATMACANETALHPRAHRAYLVYIIDEGLDDY